MKMVLNWVAVRPHGLIFNEDGAMGCPMPPEALPTPFKVVLSQFRTILLQNWVNPGFDGFFSYMFL